MKIKFFRNGKLEEFEISTRFAALILGIAFTPLKLFSKMLLKAVIILSIWIHGLFGDHASFYEVSN